MPSAVISRCLPCCHVCPLLRDDPAAEFVTAQLSNIPAPERAYVAAYLQRNVMRGACNADSGVSMFSGMLCPVDR